MCRSRNPHFCLKMGSPQPPAHISNSDTKRQGYQLCKPCFTFTAVVLVLFVVTGCKVAGLIIQPGVKQRDRAHSELMPLPWSRYHEERAVATKAQTSTDLKTLVYPKGDCVTECSADPAQFMAYCQADPSTGIPSTVCKAAGGDFNCPSLRYPDAVTPEAYCMPSFQADCSHPENFGCSKRCALFLIINFHCVTDAFFPENRTFNPSCIACNMCWDRTHEPRQAAQLLPYALVWARGPTGALFNKHFLVLPKQPCTGIESPTPGCTDDKGEHIWAHAFHEAQQLGFNYTGGAPTWALWLNAPNRRGVHQMHVHIAHFDSDRSAPGVLQGNWLVRRMARTVNVSRDAKHPTRVIGEGYYNPLAFKHTPLGRPPQDWARAYVIHVASKQPAADLGHSIKPFQLARTIAAASDLPSHGYGIAVMPRTLVSQGVLIAAVWSTSDSEQLDETELAGDPIRYSHTCHQYINTGHHRLWQRKFDKGGRWLSRSCM